MHERDTPSNPREQIITLLESDFTTPERRALAQRGEEEGNALSSFLAGAVSIEDIEARFASEECAQLATSTAQALERAAITNSFKGIIVGYIMKAYAFESRVDEIVSPYRLGFLGDKGLNGEGIYDPDQAKAIEGQALRGFLLDITNKQVLVPENEDEEGSKPIIRNRLAYAQAIDAFDAWSLDYMTTYGEDAFTGVEPNAHLEAAQRVHIMSQEESEESGWADIIERLKQLRRRDEPE